MSLCLPATRCASEQAAAHLPCRQLALPEGVAWARSVLPRGLLCSCALLLVLMSGRFAQCR